MPNLRIVIDKQYLHLEQMVDLSENPPNPIAMLIQAIGHEDNSELYLAIVNKIYGRYLKDPPRWAGIMLSDLRLDLDRLKLYGNSDPEKRMTATRRQHIVLELAGLIVECIRLRDEDMILSRAYINRTADDRVKYM